MPRYDAVLDRRGHELMPAHRTNSAGSFISLGLATGILFTFIKNASPNPYPPGNVFSHLTLTNESNDALYSLLLSNYVKIRPGIDPHQVGFEFEGLVNGALALSVVLFLIGSAMAFGKTRAAEDA